MHIQHAQFISSVVKGDINWDTTMPQIVFYGRSNSGKSSTINALLGRKSLAKSSSTPGKTQQANFFLVNESFFFIDLPGYGYAKVSKKKRQDLHELISWFITTPSETRIHVVVLDARVGITDFDRTLLETLFATHKPLCILLNKADNVTQSDLHKILTQTQEEVENHAAVIPFSARKKHGVEAFWEIVEKYL
jgi:GTP-binding protein